jgi:hypothetical protein
MSSWATIGRKSYIFAGIGMEVMNDLIEINLGKEEYNNG